MWPVYLAFAAAVFFYAANIPVRFAFTLSAGDTRALKLGVGVFGARYIIEPELSLPQLRVQADRRWGMEAVHAAAKAGRYLLKRALREGMRLRLHLGTGDAAHTALLWGAATAALSALCVPARIEPDFSARQLQVTGSGIIWLRLGHIIRAAILIALEMIKGKVNRHGQASH